MKTKSTNDSIYIGRGAGKEIHESIRNAQNSVKIVSPYLSGDYLKDLIHLHKKGANVTLITCDKIEESRYSDFRVSDLIKTNKFHDEKAERLKKILLRFSIWIFIFSVLPVVFGFVFPFLFVLGGIMFFLGIIPLIYSIIVSEYNYKYEPIFRIKVFDSYSGKNPRSTELIHSKIFVIDEETAFIGSANLTYSGFKTHYETVIKVEDARAVKDISEEIERLYASQDLRIKPVEEWAIGEKKGLL
jgi:phosphatidylserine/phosphatidylglycerophosphate/cardiolipin synthase-like enzyme